MEVTINNKKITKEYDPGINMAEDYDSDDDINIIPPQKITTSIKNVIQGLKKVEISNEETKEIDETQILEEYKNYFVIFQYFVIVLINLILEDLDSISKIKEIRLNNFENKSKLSEKKK